MAESNKVTYDEVTNTTALDVFGKHNNVNLNHK